MLTLAAIKTFFAWFLTSKIGRWVGVAIGVVLLIVGLIIAIKVRDNRLIRKGMDLVKQQQVKKLAEERQKRDENEDDIRTMPGDRLDDELRERPRDT